MYAFALRPKWLAFHILVAMLVVVMMNLGFWQLRRLDERQAFNAVVRQHGSAPTQPLAQALAEHPPAAAEWYRVTASGTYEPGGQVSVVNRSQSGTAGSFVVTPLRLPDGRLLLVNRGFVPLDTPAPPPPTGTVNVEGRLRASQVRRFGQTSDPAEGVLREVQRVDIPRLSRQLDGEAVRLYLEATASDAADSPVLAAVPPPVLSEGPHLSYAIQWFLFSAAAVVGWVLALRRSARDRRAAGRSTRDRDTVVTAGSAP